MDSVISNYAKQSKIILIVDALGSITKKRWKMMVSTDMSSTDMSSTDMFVQT